MEHPVITLLYGHILDGPVHELQDPGATTQTMLVTQVCP